MGVLEGEEGVFCGEEEAMEEEKRNAAFTAVHYSYSSFSVITVNFNSRLPAIVYCLTDSLPIPAVYATTGAVSRACRAI